MHQRGRSLGEEEQPETVDTTSKEQELDEHQSVDEEAVNKECVNEKAAEAGAMRDETAEQGGASRDSTSFTSAEQEDDIASIQRFLHGRVAPSLDSGPPPRLIVPKQTVWNKNLALMAPSSKGRQVLKAVCSLLPRSLASSMRTRR